MRPNTNFNKRISKYDRKALKLPGIEFNNHIFVGVIWPYTNRKGDQYETEMTSRGWKCNCMGFTMHGKCKHIQGVHDRLLESCSY